MSDYKNLEQIEFSDLFNRLKEHGVRAADVARELKMTSASVSMLLKGTRSPRPLTLDAMRNYVARICADDAPVLKEESPSYGVEAKLAALPEHERAEVLEIFNAMIQQAERRVSYTKKRAKPGAPGSAAS